MKICAGQLFINKDKYIYQIDYIHDDKKVLVRMVYHPQLVGDTKVLWRHLAYVSLLTNTISTFDIQRWLKKKEWRKVNKIEQALYLGIK